VHRPAFLRDSVAGQRQLTHAEHINVRAAYNYAEFRRGACTTKPLCVSRFGRLSFVDQARKFTRLIRLAPTDVLERLLLAAQPVRGLHFRDRLQ
jgi:hypothetical protein